MNYDIQFFWFSDFSYSPCSTRVSDFSDCTIISFVILWFYMILRFFRLYASSDCYSLIFPILLVLHDFPIIRFFRLLSSDFFDSPSSLHNFPILRLYRLSFSNFSDSPSSTPFYLFFRFDDSSNYSTNLHGMKWTRTFLTFILNMITYNTLWIQCLLFAL